MVGRAAQASALSFTETCGLLEEGGRARTQGRLAVRICFFIFRTQSVWTDGQLEETISILPNQVLIVTTLFVGCLREMLDFCRSRTLTDAGGLYGMEKIRTPYSFGKSLS